MAGRPWGADGYEEGRRGFRDRRPRAGRDLENGGVVNTDNGNRSLGGNTMNIARPNKEDLDAVWELVAFLNKIEQGLNPIYQPADPEDEDDFEYLSDAPADEVLEALESKSANAGLSWIMTVLDTLLSSNNDIVDQESSVLDFSPKFKQAVKDTERLDFLIEVGSAEFSKQNGQKTCCSLTEYGIRGYGSNYREALDDVMKEWKGM